VRQDQRISILRQLTHLVEVLARAGGHHPPPPLACYRGIGICLRVTNYRKDVTIGTQQGHTRGPATEHDVLAVVLQVRRGRLHVLLWRRAREPFAAAWALPGGPLALTETLGESIARQLASKVDVRELAHLEQLETRSDPGRDTRARVLATAYLGLVPADLEPALPADTQWHRVDQLPEMAYDHRSITLSGRKRLRAKLSYTNLGFALVPRTFTVTQLQDIYQAALGHEVSGTNLKRILLRREQIEETGQRSPSGRTGGRPAQLYRFRVNQIEVTDQFAVLRPPERD
jgi:8-oxo-dGTP diphosphatase